MACSHRSKAISIAVIVALFLGMVACGDDDDEDGLNAYCEFSAELDEREDVPTDDDLDRLVDLAPAEIEDDIEIVANDVRESGEEAFAEGNEEFHAALGRIEEFEEQECDR